jgi:tetrahydromethanopterin S-methyltransferase subunit F
LSFAVIIYLFFYGLRGYILTDCFQYLDFFEKRSWENESIFESKSNFEPGYVLANSIIGIFTTEPFVFQFIWTSIDLLFIYLILKRETGKFMLLSFALLVVYFDGLQMNLWRNIKGILLFFYGVRYIRSQNLLKYSFCIAIGCFFHITSIFYFPLYWLLNRDIKKSMIILCIICTLFYISGISTLFNSILVIGLAMGGKFERITSGYIDSAEDAGFTFGFMFRVVLMVILLCFYDKLKKRNLIMLNATLLYLALFTAFNSVLVMRDRFSALLSLAPVCILPYLFELLKRHTRNKYFNYIKTSLLLLIVVFMMAQVLVNHNFVGAKYNNVMLGLPNKEDAKQTIFNDL